MRQTRELGLIHFHLPALDFWSTGARHTIASWVLRIVLLWFIGGILLVESRPARIGHHDEISHDILSNVGFGLWTRDSSEGPELTIGIPTPTDAPIATSTSTSTPSPGRSPESLVDPVNIALATIGGIAGVIFLGAIFYRCYAKWSLLNNEPVWPPLDAPRDEVGQLVELIRMGMIDAHGAPPHVINWVLNGIEAPWPPPGGIESLHRRRRRRRRDHNRRIENLVPRRAGNGAPRGGRVRSRAGSLVVTSDGVIELSRQTRSGGRTGRPHSTTTITVDPLPLYVQDPEMDSSHYPITILPSEFPPLPPEFAVLETSASSIIHEPSEGNTYAQIGNAPSSAGSSVTGDIELDDESEVGSRRTASLRDHDEAPLTGLSPRPPPPAVLASSGRNSMMFSSSTMAAGTGISNGQ